MSARLLLLILCYECAYRFTDENADGDEVLVARAQDFPIIAALGLEDPDDVRVLACPPWAQRDRRVKVTERACDGCEQAISVADTSEPLLRDSGRL